MPDTRILTEYAPYLVEVWEEDDGTFTGEARSTEVGNYWCEPTCECVSAAEAERDSLTLLAEKITRDLERSQEMLCRVRLAKSDADVRTLLPGYGVVGELTEEG